MSKLMTHLVANYPNPEAFLQALQAMLDCQVEHLEIQLPFSNPLADGPTIYKANQQALTYKYSLNQILELVTSIYDAKKSKTKLYLMSYLTPISFLGFGKVIEACNLAGFSGFIIPDLIFGSNDQKQFSQLCLKKQMDLVPVISPVTSLKRLEEIKAELSLNQVVYAMARSGRTGEKTEVESLNQYLDFLKQNLAGFEIAVGFGIKEKSQVDFLNQNGFIAVIGSEIIRQIEAADQTPANIYQQITNFLQTLN